MALKSPTRLKPFQKGRDISPSRIEEVIAPEHLEPGITAARRQRILALRRRAVERHVDDALSQGSRGPQGDYTHGMMQNYIEFMSGVAPRVLKNGAEWKSTKNIAESLKLDRAARDQWLRMTPTQRENFIKLVAESDLPIFRYTGREQYVRKRMGPIHERG